MSANKGQPHDLSSAAFAAEGHARDLARGRRFTNAVIVLFLLLQALIPLRYYLGDNPLDERFSWRFFSSVSLQSHDVTITDKIDESSVADKSDEALRPPIPLALLLQVGSIKKLVGTQHPDIIDKFLCWRLEHPALEQIRYQRVTTCPDGTQLSPVDIVVDGQRPGSTAGQRYP